MLLTDERCYKYMHILIIRIMNMHNNYSLIRILPEIPLNQSTDTCLLGDYDHFEFDGKVASCTEHIASSHNALYKICSDSDLRKHCCKTCADNKKADNPGDTSISYS